ncbi:MAG: ABC transporter ATP-binding protein [Chitinophagaceae bacterium]
MNNGIAIKVEGLGKLYRLGEVGTGTISHDLNRWVARMRGKEDPFAKIGEDNDRTSKGTSDYVWALKDVNFEVKQGEVLGIIGRNGAGKSTLLKLLSKVTKPTTGRININGRIASLLEVGTGFHPEMTGRENIFLNGAIMGMTKREISSKFDEIVAFAGVERYVDTPVKRYSSGMYVRLAFAVAAHLEPEILIVDEVLAVGDAEFQKKCLGKMKDVSLNDGRTVLFVSHNMGAISSLCDESIFMKNGTIGHIGATPDIVKHYLNYGTSQSAEHIWQQPVGDEYMKIESVSLENANGERRSDFLTTEDIYVNMVVRVNQENEFLRLGLRVLSSDGNVIFTSGTQDDIDAPIMHKRGRQKVSLRIPKNFLNNGLYFITVAADIPLIRICFFEESVLSFNLEQSIGVGGMVQDDRKGYIRTNFNWQIAYE